MRILVSSHSHGIVIQMIVARLVSELSLNRANEDSIRLLRWLACERNLGSLHRRIQQAESTVATSSFKEWGASDVL